MAPSSDPTSPDEEAAFTRILRLAARTLGAAAAQFVPFGEAGRPVVYGAAADLRSVGLDVMLGDERGLVVADTAAVASFSRLAPAVRFVAAVPVVGPGGQRMGALCVLDGRPRTLSDAEQRTLAEFGYLVAEVAVEMRAREALREREALLQEVLDHLPVVVYAADRDGRFTLSEGRGLVGLERRESAVGQSMYERYRDAPEILDPLRRAMAGEDVRFAYRVQDVTYESRATPVRDARGRVAGLIGAAVDVSERVQVEAALREAKQQAEEMAHLKDLLLTNMSHEIRTPLTAIIGFSELLADVVPPEHSDVSGLIVRSGRRLLNTLNSVLDLARLESEQVAVQLTPLDVAAEVEEAVRLLHPLAEQKGLRLDFRAEAAPEPVPADAALLTRIVNNLVGNALKFTEEGGVTVEVGTDGDDVLLRVRDTGEGINEAFLPHLFDAFRQEAPDGSRPREGSGLGLAITKRLVNLMHGTIGVVSRKGSGTTFTVRLHRHGQPADARPAGDEGAELRERADAP